MARIRTIKPEFWTDEKIVRLPFEARLLFVGLWNFADDSGAIEFSPDRLRMQVFPGDPGVDVGGLVDLLAAADLLEYWVSEDNEHVAVVIRKWAAHQKIDNPSKKSITREGYRKFAIPNEARLAVARKYGCEPGGRASAQCYYCGFPGEVYWHKTYDGRPTRWVTLSDLEFDHFVSEFGGGKNSSENLVLACRTCNRGKKDKAPHEWLERRNPSIVLDSTIEDSPLEREGKGEERKVKETAAQHTDPPREEVPRETIDEDALRQAANLVGDEARGLEDLTPIRDMLAKGWSMEADILPALRAAAAKGKRGKTWAYYVPIVTEARADAASIPAKPSAAPTIATTWLDKDDPRWPAAEQAYHAATGKTALAMGSRYGAGIGFSFPAEHVPPVPNAPPRGKPEMPDIPEILRRAPLPASAGG